MKNKKNLKTENPALLPQANPDLFGHADILAKFSASYADRSIPGAWMISGPRGIGKATLVYRLVRFLLYHGSRKTDGFSPDTTSSHDLSIPQNSHVFAKVCAGSHPDLLVLEAGTGGSVSGNILVDDARKINNFLHLTPAETQYRIIIIDSIDDMNNNAANAILKLLEEPPVNSMFFLISHTPGQVLPTILSRCRHIKMRSLPEEDAIRVLYNAPNEIQRDTAVQLIALAGGSPGVAYYLYMNDGLNVYAGIIGILSALPKIDAGAIQKLGDTLSGKANENKWLVTKIILNKIIMGMARQAALTRDGGILHGQKINSPPILSVAINAEKLVEIWKETNDLIREADRLHLDRRAVITKIFSLFSERKSKNGSV